MDDLVELQRQRIYELEERVRQLEEALAPPNTYLPIEWQLTPAEARVFSHLTTKPQCAKAGIMHALYSLRHDDEPEIKIIDVFVCKLRKKLRPFGVNILTVWGQGYALENREAFLAEAS